MLQWCEKFIIMISPKPFFEVFFLGRGILSPAIWDGNINIIYLIFTNIYKLHRFFILSCICKEIYSIYIHTYITIVSCDTHVPHDDIPIPSISIHPLRSSSTNGSQLAPLRRQMYLLASQRMRDETMFFGSSKKGRFNNSWFVTVSGRILKKRQFRLVVYPPSFTRF